jgi:uncharacterized protein (TIGR00661 family)
VKKAIIYGVLNWGLGHATRSIPIIRSLIQLNYEVILCSDGDALTILQKEFPQLQFVELPGYKVRYDFRSMILNMMRYSITMLKAIHKEEKILKRLVSEYQPEFIVSDNRYGFYHKKVRSIFITHQLNIPSQKKWQSLTANRFLRQFIKRFDTCWVPDLEGSPNLSGLLSHEVTISIPIQYIGPLSRLSYLDSEQKYDIAFVLSGPEPQRTKLEKMIIEQQSELKGRCCLVRGTDVPLDNAKQDIKLSVFNLLGSKDLEKLIAESRLLVCRAGYTTIMDLVSLHKSAVLIPTPGQPEQEYLASHLSTQFPNFSFVNQDDFNISKLDGEIEHWQGDIEIPLWSDEKLKILLNV